MNPLFDDEGKLIKSDRLDSFAIGLSLAVLLPFVVMLILVEREMYLSFGDAVSYAWDLFGNKIFMQYVTLAFIPNMILFFFAYKTERWKLCRGLVVATLGLFAVYAFRTFIV